MRKLTLVVLSLVLALAVNAQNKINVQDFSDKYYATIYTQNSDEGETYIVISEKGTNSELIRVATDVSFDTDNEDVVKANVVERPYGEQSCVIYDDFNFDGIKDFAIQDGNNSCYGGPSFQIFLAQGDKFVANDDFTDLSQSFCGMFGTDPESKTIGVMTKDGCCWHKFNTYDVVNNKPRLIESVVEDAFASPYYAVTTIEELDKKTNKMKTSSSDMLILESLQPLFSFEIAKNGKQIYLFSNSTISDDGDGLSYAFVNEDKVELMYPKSSDDSKRIDFTYHKEPNTLEFTIKDAKYTIYSTPQAVGVKVEVKGKVYDMLGKISSVQGSLDSVLDKGLVNIATTTR